VSGRARRVVVPAALAAPLVEWVAQRPPVGLLSWVALRLLDDMAYGAGLWAGCLREASGAAILPRLLARSGGQPGPVREEHWNRRTR
ncbi:MAG: hypothetical protein ACRDYB_13535, partial [Acidimicrobiales bacterium]